MSFSILFLSFLAHTFLSFVLPVDGHSLDDKCCDDFV